MGTAGQLVHANAIRKNYYHSSPTTASLHNTSPLPLSLSLPNSYRKSHQHELAIRRLRCCSNSTSTPKPRGFGSPPQQPATAKKPARGIRDEMTPVLPPRKSSSQRSVTVPNEAPILSSQIDGKSNSTSTDNQFEERLQAVKRSALQQKRAEQEKQYGAIDYDAPIEPKSGSVGTGTKIGAGIAVVIFGLVFAFGDFLPSGSDAPTEEAPLFDSRISSEDRENLKKRLQQFEETLSVSPEDSGALECFSREQH